MPLGISERQEIVKVRNSVVLTLTKKNLAILLPTRCRTFFVLYFDLVFKWGVPSSFVPLRKNRFLIK